MIKIFSGQAVKLFFKQEMKGHHWIIYLNKSLALIISFSYKDLWLFSSNGWDVGFTPVICVCRM